MTVETRNLPERGSALLCEVRWGSSNDRAWYEVLLRRLFGPHDQVMTEPGEDESPGSVSEYILGANRSVVRSSANVP
jgi:hypothetical protein